jgi:hypothetical protein
MAGHDWICPRQRGHDWRVELVISVRIGQPSLGPGLKVCALRRLREVKSATFTGERNRMARAELTAGLQQLIWKRWPRRLL